MLLQGAELYKLEARNEETIQRFGQGTPDDWIERHLYTPHTVLGLGVMLAIDLVLFGAVGLTIWAIQMIWIPLFAAGVINGVGHYWGYRTFQTEEASRNIAPWGVLIGGEELHNNHHAPLIGPTVAQVVGVGRGVDLHTDAELFEPGDDQEDRSTRPTRCDQKEH